MGRGNRATTSAAATTASAVPSKIYRHQQTPLTLRPMRQGVQLQQGELQVNLATARRLQKTIIGLQLLLDEGWSREYDFRPTRSFGPGHGERFMGWGDHGTDLHIGQGLLPPDAPPISMEARVLHGSPRMWRQLLRDLQQLQAGADFHALTVVERPAPVTDLQQTLLGRRRTS